MTQGFKVMGQAYGIDSLITDGYGAFEGESYGPVHIHHDDFGARESYSCSTIDQEPECVVAVGQLCLRCVDPSEPTPLCD